MKTTLLSFSLFSIIIILLSCSKSMPTPATPAPPVKTDSSTFLIQLLNPYPGDTDAGVMFHDITGKLLRFSTFAGKDTILFSTHDSLPGNKINVTFFTPIYNGSTLTECDLYSYLYNNLGQVWSIGSQANGVAPIQSGTFLIQVNGINTDGHFNASDKDGYALDGDSWDYAAHTLSSQVPLIANSPDYLVHYWDPGIQPGYTFIHNVTAGSTYNLNVKDLRPYNKTIVVNFPTAKLINYGVNNVDNLNSPNDGFVLDGSYGSGPGSFDSAVTQVTLGYLDTFAIYKTFFTVSYDSLKYTYGYQGVGPAPTSIDLPLSANFSTTNDSINNYQYNSSQNFSLRLSNWFYTNFPNTPETSVYWTVYAPQGAEQHFLELPDSFATKYPDINFANLKFGSSQFFTEGNSYDDFISALFKQGSVPTQYEQYYVIVNK